MFATMTFLVPSAAVFQKGDTGVVNVIIDVDGRDGMLRNGGNSAHLAAFGLGAHKDWVTE